MRLSACIAHERIRRSHAVIGNMRIHHILSIFSSLPVCVLFLPSVNWREPSRVSKVVTPIDDPVTFTDGRLKTTPSRQNEITGIGLYCNEDGIIHSLKRWRSRSPGLTRSRMALRCTDGRTQYRHTIARALLFGADHRFFSSSQRVATIRSIRRFPAR
ncbi:hypothetical protein KCP74_03225 [Salmonella enterica subsp. enterica]|nr:hypothetical protein KCP74_03225 [Salmonella enterica subsp. enterica]